MKIFLFLISVIILLTGCGGGNSNSIDSNSIDNPTREIYQKNIRSGETVSLQYNESNIKSYKWWGENGELLGTSPQITWVAPDQPGEHVITLETTDAYNNVKKVNIVLKVVNLGNSPEITLNGDQNITLTVGSTYTELGATATDKEDGDLTDKISIIGSVDTSKPGSYKIIYSITDSSGLSNSITRNVTVVDPYANLTTPAHTFAQIKQMMLASKDGVLDNLTYICLGDSTRAISSVQHSERYFNAVAEALKKYNVNSILMARGSHMLKQFLDGSEHPSLSDLISAIPNDGGSTIVDISLGVNDLFKFNDIYGGENFTTNKDQYKDEIKARLIEAVDKIREAKPKTTIFLTTPNPTRDWSGGTKLMLEVYKEVSRELDLPLADFADEKMDGGDTEGGRFDSWYRDGIHFSNYGLAELSNYIISKITPEN